MANASTCAALTEPSSSTSDLRSNLISHRQGSANQRPPYTETTRDSPERLTLTEESHRFSRVPPLKTRHPTSDSFSREMLRHGGAVHLVLGGELGNGCSRQILVDQTIDLSGGQKGLRSCNRPHDWPPNVANRALATPLRGAVDTTLPTLDQGLLHRGKVCEQST